MANYFLRLHEVALIRQKILEPREHEVNQVSVPVYRQVQIKPLTIDLDC